MVKNRGWNRRRERNGAPEIKMRFIFGPVTITGGRIRGSARGYDHFAPEVAALEALRPRPSESRRSVWIIGVVVGTIGGGFGPVEFVIVFMQTHL